MVEQAAVGVEKCANLAAEKGLQIRSVCEDVREFTIAKNQYAIISAIALSASVT